MKAQLKFGGLMVAFGLSTSLAHAQSAERVAALDPATAPSDSAPAEAPSAASVVSPATEPGAPPVETAPATAKAPAAPPPPQAAPIAPTSDAPSFTLGFSGRAKDAPTARSSTLPIRAQRKLALLGEVGWNGLAGSGLVLTYNAHPHLAFDLAGGLSLTGWKAGVRTRYNLLTGPFTPFVGAGLSMSSGWKGARLGRSYRHHDRSDDDDGDDFDFDPTKEGKYDVKRSEFAQAVVGFEFIHRHGFTMQATAGYSWVLNENNYTFVTGKRDDTLASVLFGSGPVLAAAFGYAFD